MNKNSNKNKLSKNLKYISIASAITLCASISGPGSEASANPFRTLWNRFTGLFSSSSTTTSNSRLNRPSSNATMSDSSSSSSKGNSSLWSKLKSRFSSKTSSTSSNVTSTSNLNTDNLNEPTPPTTSSNLKTTNLDDPIPPTTSSSLWTRFKGIFTGGSKTSSDKNKSGVTNHSYTVDSDSDGEFNPKFDDQNLKNLRFVVNSSGSGTLPKVNLSDKTSTGSSTGMQQPNVKTSSQTSSSGSDGIQYADLDFGSNNTTGIIHGSGNKTEYASIITSSGGTTSSNASSLSTGSDGSGTRPIPKPRTKFFSNNSSSTTGPNGGIIVGKGDGFLSEVVGDDVIITSTGNSQPAPPTPARPKGLGNPNYTPRVGSLTPKTTGTSSNTNDDGNNSNTKPLTLTSKIDSSTSTNSVGTQTSWPQSVIPKDSVITRNTSTITIGGNSTGGDKKPKMVTFNFDQ